MHTLHRTASTDSLISLLRLSERNALLYRLDTFWNLMRMGAGFSFRTAAHTIGEANFYVRFFSGVYSCPSRPHNVI